MRVRAAAVERLDCDLEGYNDVFELIKEKLK